MRWTLVARQAILGSCLCLGLASCDKEDKGAGNTPAVGVASSAAARSGQALCLRFCDKLAECEPERRRMVSEISRQTRPQRGGPLSDEMVEAIEKVSQEEGDQHNAEAVKRVELECRRQCQDPSVTTGQLPGVECLDVPCDQYMACSLRAMTEQGKR